MAARSRIFVPKLCGYDHMQMPVYFFCLGFSGVERALSLRVSGVRSSVVTAAGREGLGGTGRAWLVAAPDPGSGGVGLRFQARAVLFFVPLLVMTSRRVL